MPVSKPKPKPIGRPKLHKDDAKSSIVPVRFNSENRKRVERAAKAKGQTVSHWIRDAINAAMDSEA